jgi:spore coat assembly protein
MLVVPLLTALTQGWAIGWASTPYDTRWAVRYPKRAALMSAAGPAGNLLIAFVAFMLIKAGLATGWFLPPDSVTFEHLVTGVGNGRTFIGELLSIFLTLNVLLCAFNLIPLPPLDTGHDGFIKGEDSYTNIASYRNSRYFIEAVREARKYNSDMDSLVIFAGACQSLYKQIMKAGANFASAPFRDLIHALDPVRVCQKIAFTGIDKVLDAKEVIDNTITGKTGIGGVQTRGKYREGFPEEPYS